jgi:hypothetical protein
MSCLVDGAIKGFLHYFNYSLMIPLSVEHFYNIKGVILATIEGGIIFFTILFMEQTTNTIMAILKNKNKQIS